MGSILGLRNGWDRRGVLVYMCVSIYVLSNQEELTIHVLLEE